MNASATRADERAPPRNGLPRDLCRPLAGSKQSAGHAKYRRKRRFARDSTAPRGRHPEIFAGPRRQALPPTGRISRPRTGL